MKKIISLLLFFFIATALCVFAVDVKTLPSKTHKFVKKFYDTGELWRTHYYSKKSGKIDGPSYYYFKSGALYRTEEHEDGVMAGIRREFYENGQLFSLEPYENGKLNGIRKEFYELEHVRREELWENNKLLSIKLYTFDGDILFEANFK